MSLSSFSHYFLHLVQALFIVHDYIVSNSFNSENDSKFSFWLPCWVAWIIFHLFLHTISADRFQLRADAPAEVSYCVCQELLSAAFGGGRSVASLSKKNSFSISRNHLVDAFKWYRTVYNNGIRPCLPKLSSFVLCFGYIDPINSVLRRSPLASLMFHTEFREVVACQYFSWFILKYRTQRCKENCLSSIFVCSSSSNESWHENWSTIEGTFYVTYELFPIAWISTCPNSSGASNFQLYVLEGHFCTIKDFYLWNACIIGTWSCGFPNRYISSHPGPRILSFHTSGTHFALSVSLNPNEQRRRLLCHLDQSDVPISWPILRFRLKEHLPGAICWQECQPTSFVPQEESLPQSTRGSQEHVPATREFPRCGIGSSLQQMIRLPLQQLSLSLSFVIIPYLWDLGPSSRWGKAST